MASSSGLLKFNVETKEFENNLKNEISSCNSIAKVDNETFLITIDRGLAIVDYSNKDTQHSFSLKRKDLASYVFNSSMIDNSGNVWLGVLNRGVLLINNVRSLVNNNDYNFQFFTDDKPALRVSSIVSMSNSHCLVSTFDEGLYEFDVNPNPFKNYNIEMDFEHGLRSNDVRHMSSIDSDRMYLIASFGRLTLFNTKTQKFEPLNFKLPKNKKTELLLFLLTQKIIYGLG